MEAAGHQFELFARPPQPLGAQRPADQRPPTVCYWDYCPNCSARLQNEKCKFRCPRCHYFMSCSDFD